jgi:cytochrome c-type biogenesis protein
MSGPELVPIVVWPFLFGLFGFIEPCAIGATLLFIKTLEGKPARVKLAQVFFFTLARTVFTGLLGVLAALVGSWFLGLQKAVWILVGVLYAAIGLLYLTGRISILMRSIGPRLATLSDPRSSALLGAVLGFNIPACAGPLLLALLAATAAEGASGATMAKGFVSLGLFGFALSLPLAVAVLFAPMRRVLDWLAGLSRRIPFWTGIVFLALGAWSIWFGFFVSIT